MSRGRYFLRGIVLVIITVFVIVGVINFIRIPLPGGLGILPAKDYQNFEDMKKLMRIKELVERGYYKEVDKEDLEEEAIRGMLKALDDPYTVYMNKEEYASFMVHTTGTYGGIGIVVSEGEDGLITIVAPIEDTPGERAGLAAGDKIIKVDNKEVSGDQLDQAVIMMKGAEGTKVTLTILREGVEKPFDVTITREEIRLKTVKSQVVEGNIGYMRISAFDERTYADFNKALRSLSQSGIKGLVIDLRNNPGGLLDQVVKVADALMDKGLIVYTEDRQGKREEEMSDAKNLGLPLVILVNGGSASASEILSGAVQDSGTGVLVGTKTFGKALVQTVRELEDGSAVKYTIAQYYTPSGKSIQGKGIQPDYVVEMPKDGVMGDIEGGKDPQLLKAIEIIKSQI